MSHCLDINGVKMINIKNAALQTGYSRDYVTRLAREGKIVASQIERNWFVDLDSLMHYSATIADEQRLRQQQLSEERKRERLAVEGVRNNLGIKNMPRGFQQRPKVVACVALVLGLLTGLVLQNIPFISEGFGQQVASAPLGQLKNAESDDRAPFKEAPSDVSGQDSSLNFSHEAFRLATLADPTQGILILPQATSSTITNPHELFSDDVRVVTDDKGHDFLARVDERGVVVEKIPFVMVPVKQ